MPIPQFQLDAIAAAKVSDAPAHVIGGAVRAAQECGLTVGLYFDSGADEEYADDLGYGYAPLLAAPLLFHPLLGRFVAHVEPDGTITPL